MSRNAIPRQRLPQTQDLSDKKRNRFGGSTRNTNPYQQQREVFRSPITHKLNNQFQNESGKKISYIESQQQQQEADSLRRRGQFGIPRKAQITKPTMMKYEHEMTYEEKRKNQLEDELLQAQVQRDKVRVF